MRWRADVTTSVGTTAAAGEIVIDFQRQKKSDWYRELSNQAADHALLFGLRGDELAASLAAELAEAYADAANVWVFLEDIKDMAA